MEMDAKLSCSAAHEWAIILAGGDGTRLKSLTRRITGDDRPKQFCRLLGSDTLLEQTRRRAELEFASARTLYLVNGAHERYYAPILTGERPATLVVQPRNRGTAPAILYALLRITAVDPQAIVACFPSDHYLSHDRCFMDQIRSFLHVIRRRSDLVLLLGITPESAETEYGWIEPAGPIVTHPAAPVFGVRRFWEKPTAAIAEQLLARGCLWNSFVMLGAARALLETVEGALPELYGEFAALSGSFGTRREAAAVSELYERMAEINFSHQVLAVTSDRLAVSPVKGVRWNDLGEPKRVMASLDMAGERPFWAEPAFTVSSHPAI